MSEQHDPRKALDLLDEIDRGFSPDTDSIREIIAKLVAERDFQEQKAAKWRDVLERIESNRNETIAEIVAERDARYTREELKQVIAKLNPDHVYHPEFWDEVDAILAQHDRENAPNLDHEDSMAEAREVQADLEKERALSLTQDVLNL